MPRSSSSASAGVAVARSGAAWRPSIGPTPGCWASSSTACPSATTPTIRATTARPRRPMKRPTARSRPRPGSSPAGRGCGRRRCQAARGRGRPERRDVGPEAGHDRTAPGANARPAGPDPAEADLGAPTRAATGRAQVRETAPASAAGDHEQARSPGGPRGPRGAGQGSDAEDAQPDGSAMTRAPSGARQ